MGEVYLAQDTRLGRCVAIKILPEKFSRDAQRMARFDREAKVLASLNQPNIAAIYGLEESNGVRALIMEFVDGPTLRSVSRRARFLSMKHCRSQSKSPKHSNMRTSAASSIAT
jgi:serine/threonine protein kinase